MGRIPDVHSHAPWKFSEDALFYYLHDAAGKPIAVVNKNAVGEERARGNLLAMLAAPDVLEALRTQPAYGDDWKKKVRNAYACASGLVEHFLAARKKGK